MTYAVNSSTLPADKRSKSAKKESFMMVPRRIESSINLAQLPTEVLREIFTHSTPRTVTVSQMVCRRFYDLVTQDRNLNSCVQNSRAMTDPRATVYRQPGPLGAMRMQPGDWVANEFIREKKGPDIITNPFLLQGARYTSLQGKPYFHEEIQSAKRVEVLARKHCSSFVSYVRFSERAEVDFRSAINAYTGHVLYGVFALCAVTSYYSASMAIHGMLAASCLISVSCPAALCVYPALLVYRGYKRERAEIIKEIHELGEPDAEFARILQLKALDGPVLDSVSLEYVFEQSRNYTLLAEVREGGAQKYR
ncbi:MAG: F-box protein [Cytophagaceae bacterium]|nr:MAG: F-box protein [Cytophagaceae bacterium]